MVKKRKGQTIGDRVRHLLELRWGGNQTEMAREIGCSQSTLSQVAHGKEPGKRLTTMIASHQDVNQTWLLHGDGEPLVANGNSATFSPFRIPIVTHPLDGIPNQDAVSALYDAPAEYRKDTCYWLELQTGGTNSPRRADGRPATRPLADRNVSRIFSEDSKLL